MNWTNSLASLAAVALSLQAGVMNESQAAAANLELIGPSSSRRISLQEMKTKLQSQQVRIQDPVYKIAKSFDAFLLTDVLRLAGMDLSADIDEIVFTAKDGYSPSMPVEKLRKHKAYLAYQERGTSGGFGKVVQGKAMVSPAPFYLVWEEGEKLANDVPWPYQLVRIEAVDFKKKFPAIHPSGASAGSGAMRGFMLFRAQCLNCHSVNLEGGDIGPELNAPKNITEYWEKKTLKHFIRDATSFRYKSKMPPFPQLSDKQIDDLLVYLEHMKSHKVTP